MHIRCVLCNEAFSSVDALEAHIASDHFFSLPYECERCRFAKFPTEWAVERHYEEGHGLTEYSVRYRVSPELRARRCEIKMCVQRSLDAFSIAGGVAAKEDGPQLMTAEGGAQQFASPSRKAADGDASTEVSSSQAAHDEDLLAASQQQQALEKCAADVDADEIIALDVDISHKPAAGAGGRTDPHPTALIHVQQQQQPRLRGRPPMIKHNDPAVPRRGPGRPRLFNEPTFEQPIMYISDVSSHQQQLQKFAEDAKRSPSSSASDEKAFLQRAIHQQQQQQQLQQKGVGGNPSAVAYAQQQQPIVTRFMLHQPPVYRGVAPSQQSTTAMRQPPPAQHAYGRSMVRQLAPKILPTLQSVQQQNISGGNELRQKHQAAAAQQQPSSQFHNSQQQASMVARAPSRGRPPVAKSQQQFVAHRPRMMAAHLHHQQQPQQQFSGWPRGFAPPGTNVRFAPAAPGLMTRPSPVMFDAKMLINQPPPRIRNSKCPKRGMPQNRPNEVPCKKCGILVNSRATSLMYHVNVKHLRFPLFECLQCGQKFMWNRAAALRHVLRHGGDEAMVRDNSSQHFGALNRVRSECFDVELATSYRWPHRLSAPLTMLNRRPIGEGLSPVKQQQQQNVSAHNHPSSSMSADVQQLSSLPSSSNQASAELSMPPEGWASLLAEIQKATTTTPSSGFSEQLVKQEAPCSMQEDEQAAEVDVSKEQQISSQRNRGEAMEVEHEEEDDECEEMMMVLDENGLVRTGGEPSDGGEEGEHEPLQLSSWQQEMEDDREQGQQHEFFLWDEMEEIEVEGGGEGAEEQRPKTTGDACSNEGDEGASASSPSFALPYAGEFKPKYESITETDGKF